MRGRNLPSISSEHELNPGRLWYALVHFASRVAALSVFDYRCYNGGVVPQSGAVILAANHQSFLDPWLVGLGQPRACSYLARDTLFRVPGFGRLIASVNAFPVSRESQAPRQSLELCLAILRAKRPLVLFPEGTRSQDGGMLPLKRGVVLIAKKARCPVVPVYVDGSFDLWPRHRALPRPGSIRVFLGEPLWYDDRDRGEKISVSSENSGRDLSRGMDDGLIPPSSPHSSGGEKEGSMSSAAFLEALGEAYRVLQAKARKVRREQRFAVRPFFPS